MKIFNTLVASDISDLSCQLNKIKRINIKIEFIERSQSHLPIEVLYS